MGNNKNTQKAKRNKKKLKFDTEIKLTYKNLHSTLQTGKQT